MTTRLPPAEELEHLKLACEISKTPVAEIVVAERHHAVVNGFRIHYLDWGTKGRPPIVFLHGGALNAHTWDVVWHSVLPMIAYLVGAFAAETMLMKNSLMENMSADYVRTALAKGLSWRRAVFVHALRNSLIPMATSIGSLLGIFVAGSFLIERVFNIEGIGLLAFEAIQSRDFPVVMGILVIDSVLLMAGNLVSDLAVAFVDPRVRFE